MPKTVKTGIWKFALLGSLMAPVFANAQFYTFENNKKPNWETPADLIADAAETAVNLMKWEFHDMKRPDPSEKYVRLKHFGNWIDDKNDEVCYDTRNKLLVETSLVPVEFNEKNKCKVKTGKWIDPYGGKTYTQALGDVEIDHVVALKNAYDSGAWNWDYKTRCLYANFVGYENHLLVVALVENRRKAAKAPDEWMPSDNNFACQHIQNWLAIKMLWNLSMTQPEAQAIEDEAKANNCDIHGFSFPKKEISRIRKFMKDHANLCQ